MFFSFLGKGKAAGIAEGHRDSAMKMHKKGTLEAEISELTGVSRTELALLKRGLKKELC